MNHQEITKLLLMADKIGTLEAGKEPVWKAVRSVTSGLRKRVKTVNLLKKVMEIAEKSKKGRVIK